MKFTKTKGKKEALLYRLSTTHIYSQRPPFCSFCSKAGSKASTPSAQSHRAAHRYRAPGPWRLRTQSRPELTPHSGPGLGRLLKSTQSFFILTTLEPPPLFWTLWWDFPGFSPLFLLIPSAFHLQISLLLTLPALLLLTLSLISLDYWLHFLPMRLITLKSASPDPSPELQTHVSKCRLDISPECSMNTSYRHVHNSTPFLPHQTPPFSTKSSTINSVCYIRKQDAETSLVVQWLRLWTSTAGDMNSIRGRGIELLNDVQHDKQKDNRTSPISLHGPLPPSLHIQLLTSLASIRSSVWTSSRPSCALS